MLVAKELALAQSKFAPRFAVKVAYAQKDTSERPPMVNVLKHLSAHKSVQKIKNGLIVDITFAKIATSIQGLANRAVLLQAVHALMVSVEIQQVNAFSQSNAQKQSLRQEFAQKIKSGLDVDGTFV
jgi:hypothetical protein